jgi:hypothetical protein
MKMRNDYEFFQGLCCGCRAAIKQEDVDPDKLYDQWLCFRCRAELEELPPRHKITFDNLKREMEKVYGKAKHLEGTVAVLEGFIIAHGLNPNEADDSYAAVPAQGATEGRSPNKEVDRDE